MTDIAGFPRFVSAGRAFVYVLPCREQDVLKVGFSREPMQRLHALHRRFAVFFDLQRALLVETDTVQEARAIERTLLRRFAPMRVSAPLAVRELARGGTEWLAGVAPQVETLARSLAGDGGYLIHAPLVRWLRERVLESGDVLYGWSAQLLDAIAYQHFNPAPPGGGDTRPGQALRAALDLLSALDLPLQEMVPQPVSDWYRYGSLPERG